VRAGTGLLPEWTPQWGGMLAWPHEDTDWAPVLERVEPVYAQLVRHISTREKVLLLCRDGKHRHHIQQVLTAAGASLDALHWQELDFDDTWTRDYGPLAVQRPRGAELVDFVFNGWGGKHDARRDNAINRQIAWRVPLRQPALVLEGGAVDTNGLGTLVTTRSCLLHPGRNPGLDSRTLDQRLYEYLGVDDIVWLQHGFLDGDDTDGHVDMLVRFCNARHLAFVQCSDEHDPHYSQLRALENELRELAHQRNWQLTPLPLPPALHDDQGRRLPATYANFLILNDAVLMPAYDVETDEPARRQLQSAFPHRVVETLYCRPLLEQGGSLHCATLQLPEGVI